jgi:hypothetical protein
MPLHTVYVLKKLRHYSDYSKLISFLNIVILYYIDYIYFILLLSLFYLFSLFSFFWRHVSKIPAPLPNLTPLNLTPHCISILLFQNCSKHHSNRM